MSAARSGVGSTRSVIAHQIPGSFAEPRVCLRLDREAGHERLALAVLHGRDCHVPLELDSLFGPPRERVRLRYPSRDTTPGPRPSRPACPGNGGPPMTFGRDRQGLKSLTPLVDLLPPSPSPSDVTCVVGLSGDGLVLSMFVFAFVPRTPDRHLSDVSRRDQHPLAVGLGGQVEGPSRPVEVERTARG